MTPQELSAFEKLGNGQAQETAAFEGGKRCDSLGNRLNCEVCGADIARDRGRCTNARCASCHAQYCTAGGDTSPGHNRRWPLDLRAVTDRVDKLRAEREEASETQQWLPEDEAEELASLETLLAALGVSHV